MLFKKIKCATILTGVSCCLPSTQRVLCPLSSNKKTAGHNYGLFCYEQRRFHLNVWVVGDSFLFQKN